MTADPSTPPALVADLDAQVRAVVRRHAASTGRRRRIGCDSRDHDERSLTGAVLPMPGRDAVVAELVARMSGFGPLQRYVDDPTVEEVSAKPRGGNALSCRHVGESPAGRQVAK